MEYTEGEAHAIFNERIYRGACILLQGWAYPDANKTEKDIELQAFDEAIDVARRLWFRVMERNL